MIGVISFVNFAFANTKKLTNQDPLSSYPSFPITAGGESATDDNHSSDDGPPPAVLHKDKSSSLTSHSANIGDSSDDGPPPAVLHKDESHNAEDLDWTTADNNTIPEKYMNGLSNCESSAAADGHLTLVEIMDCFYKVF